MPGTTLEQAEAQLDAARNALLELSSVQETQTTGTTGGRKTIFADRASIIATIKYWEGEVRRLSGSSSNRVSHGVVVCG